MTVGFFSRRSARRAVLCLVLASSSLAAFASPAATPFPNLQALEARGVAVTAMAVDLNSGRSFWELDSERRLSPASLSKLYTAAAALEHWGPEHSFETRLLADGHRDGAVLRGDLVLLGGGDPALTTENLWTLAGALRSAGVEQVQGRLVINESRFGALPCSTKDRCDAQRYSRNAYDAPLSAAGVNYGAWCVEALPAGRAGQPAIVRLCPVHVPEVEIRGKVETVAAGKGSRLWAERRTERGRDVILVSGQMALGAEPKRVYRAASDAAMQTGLLLRRVLELVGVDLEGPVVVDDAPLKPGLRTLAKVDGLRMTGLISRMLTFSNNYMADVLALDLLAEDPTLARPLSLEHAGRRVLHWRQPPAGALEVVHTAGLAPPVLLNGSGLNTGSAVSAQDLVALLSDVYRRSELFPQFVGALSVPQFSPLGSLRGDSPGWRSRVAVKSGSLTEPVTVYGVAGYFRTRTDGWGAFVVLVNGAGELSKIPYSTVHATVRRDVELMLQNF